MGNQNKKTKNRKILFAVVLLFVVFLLLYADQCRMKCNCMNESVCSKLCKTILLLFKIESCPYNDSFKKPFIEDKYIPEFKNDKECKVNSDCLVFEYCDGCYNNTHKSELSHINKANPPEYYNCEDPETCICKDNVCVPEYR